MDAPVAFTSVLRDAPPQPRPQRQIDVFVAEGFARKLIQRSKDLRSPHSAVSVKVAYARLKGAQGKDVARAGSVANCARCSNAALFGSKRCKLRLCNLELSDNADHLFYPVSGEYAPQTAASLGKA
ncbi:MAG: hypothetical protein FRX48_07801 [Lasallia pustulata]|uniref:Uncharacterized protein n=1 Tax=Lasallia pustulata TaxID=136370 RepID=A0A5M8PH44_9LECA|nr:MAG: hypothetical protein FRX48_07801 [Lasallia pustulata]